MGGRAAVGLALVCVLVALAGCSGSASKDSRSADVVAIGGIRQTSSCKSAELSSFLAHRPAPKALAGALATEILRSYAIFRRRAVPSYEPNALKLSELAGELRKHYELASYYPAYLRRIRSYLGGRADYVVPAFARVERLLPKNCTSAARRRLETELQRRRVTEPVYCILETGSRENGQGPGCEPFAQALESRRAFAVSDILGTPTLELVPDGVASVRVDYSGLTPLTVPVADNAFLLVPPNDSRSRLARELARLAEATEVQGETQRRSAVRVYNTVYQRTLPVTIEWLDQAGRTVRRLTRPSPATLFSKTALGGLDAPLEGE